MSDLILLLVVLGGFTAVVVLLLALRMVAIGFLRTKGWICEKLNL